LRHMDYHLSVSLWTARVDVRVLLLTVNDWMTHLNRYIWVGMTRDITRSNRGPAHLLCKAR